MNNELRHILKQRWLFLLFEFAYPEFQRRLWLEASYPDMIGGYEEAICQYFDDLNLETGYDEFVKDEIITQKEFDIVANFHIQLDKYVSESAKKLLDDRSILGDNDWITITNFAKQNWEELKRTITDSKELAYMIGLEKQYLAD